MSSNSTPEARALPVQGRQAAIQSAVAVRAEHVTKVIAQAPISARGILKRALEGTGGRKNAIIAMCLHCTGYDRETVRTCTGWSCPLWKYRPFRAGAETTRKSGVVEGPRPEKEAP